MINKLKHYFFSQILRIRITLCLGKIESKMRFWDRTKMTHNKMIRKKMLKSKLDKFFGFIISYYQKTARNQDKFWL